MAAAQAAAALLPAAQSGQIADVREHLIFQLGQLQVRVWVCLYTAGDVVCRTSVDVLLAASPG